MIMDKKFTYREMQENLPDYVFGRITSENKEIFERTLPDFPDLQDEIKDVRNVFHKVDSMNLNAKIEKQTRNLSVKVQERLKKMPVRHRYQSILFRYIVPTFGLAVIVYYLFNFNWNNDVNIDKSKVQNNLSEFTIVKPAEALTLIQDTVSANSIMEISGELESSFENEYDIALIDDYESLLNELYSEALSDNIFEDNSLPEELIPDNNFTPLNILLKDLDQIEENDFQQIIKAMENADYFS